MAGEANLAAFLESSPPAKLITPGLALVELPNAGWKARRLGAISNYQFDAIAQLTPSLFNELMPARPAADGRTPVVPAA